MGVKCLGTSTKSCFLLGQSWPNDPSSVLAYSFVGVFLACVWDPHTVPLEKGLTTLSFFSPTERLRADRLEIHNGGSVFMGSEIFSLVGLWVP